MQHQVKPSIEQIRQLWNGLAPVYSSIDVSVQTFYYTLINMMKMNKAQHIYEVGCGIGKMIPYMLSIKPEDCTYVACDVSEKMIECARSYLSNYMKKMGVTESFDKVMERQHLELGVHDGEIPFKASYKFDRIILNSVLQITPDPKKMMQSLREVAAQGCLMGVTIWGDKSRSNLYNLPMECRKSMNKEMPGTRDMFHLYNKLEQLGAETGWEMVIQWEQNTPINAIEYEADLAKVVREVSEIDANICSFVEKKVKETFSKKGILNFPVQMAIFRRK